MSLAPDAPTPAGSPTGTQALDRAAQVVATVVHADEPLSFQQISTECELPKSTASRLLTALERTDLLERNVAGGYVAGPLFWLYATRHDPWEELVRIAHPVLVEIGEHTRETVHLGVARHDRVAHIDQVDSDFLLGTRDWTGVEVPDHRSALGRVLIAFDALPVPMTALDRSEGRTWAPGEFAAILPEIRSAGFAATLDELEPGLTAVAAPVRGVDGAVFGAVGVSGPTSRIAPRIPEFGDLLVTWADTLSATLRRSTGREGMA